MFFYLLSNLLFLFACYFRSQLILKNSIIAQIILLQIGAIVSRYISIFWLKNPAAFNDDFWCQFINIWILAASIIPQVVLNVLPGASPLLFHVCCGTNPNIDMNKNQGIINYPLLVLLIFYVMVFLVFGGKISFYKYKIADNQPSVSRNIFMKTLEKQSLGDLTLSTWGIIGTNTAAFLYFKIRELNPEQLNIYPNYIFIYWIQLVNGPLTCIIILSICYQRNDAMRKVMMREVKNFLGI